MNELTVDTAQPNESFAQLLEESAFSKEKPEGKVVRGRIISVGQDFVLVDVGLKAEGRVPLREFARAQEVVNVDDEVNVFVERLEDSEGLAVLSREKARREKAWQQLVHKFEAQEKIMGTIFNRVKGGFTVDLGGAIAFLPGSQIDVRRVRDPAHLMQTPQEFYILKMDHSRGNIVVSRRAIMEEARAEQRATLMESLKEGQIVEGVVKNVTNYGAFVDLGGIDGLLHVTDISWKRINHPSEVLQVGQTVRVHINRFNAESQRISLGMKQLESDPWDAVVTTYVVGEKYKGTITNVADYGAFVELEAGVEGLVHVSEMSWVKKNVHPSKVVAVSSEVEVMVLDVDLAKRRISLGLKQCQPHPWQRLKEDHPVGSVVEGEVRNVTEFGIFVGINSDVDGMVHMSDLDWAVPGPEALRNYKRGDKVTVKILDINIEKERVALGVKQMSENPASTIPGGFKKGDTVTCTVTAIQSGLLEVRLSDGTEGMIKRSELSNDADLKKTSRFSDGEELEGRVVGVDRTSGKLSVSLRATETDAIENYASEESGASLGEILGVALKEHQEGKEAKESQSRADDEEKESEKGA